jgi:MSHA biogenesis protein MshJ
MQIVEKVEQWLNLRTPREKIYVLICTLFVISFVWFALWESSYQGIRKAQVSDKESVESKITSFKAQNQIMKKAINDSKLIKKRELIKQQLHDVDTQINAISTQLVSSAAMGKALKDILAKTSGLSLLRLTNAEGPVITSVIPQKDNSNTKIKLFQHNFILELEGDYRSNVDFLKSLEKSPFRFFTDSIEYKVTEYPQANVKLKLHTVSKEQDLINE